MRNTVRGTIGALVVGLSFVAAVPAEACSIAMPPPLLFVLEDGQMSPESSGIYEQETVAWAPSILIRSTATASVVTRYWGEPPANTGIQYEGGTWFPFLDRFSGNSCAGLVDRDFNPLTPDGPVGTLGYGVSQRPAKTEGPLSPEEAAAQGSIPWHRFAPQLPLASGVDTGALSAAELARLDEVYGRPMVVEVTAFTRIQATIAVWFPILALIAVVFFVVRFVLLHRRTMPNGQL